MRNRRARGTFLLTIILSFIFTFSKNVRAFGVSELVGCAPSMVPDFLGKLREGVRAALTPPPTSELSLESRVAFFGFPHDFVLRDLIRRRVKNDLRRLPPEVLARDLNEIPQYAGMSLDRLLGGFESLIVGDPTESDHLSEIWLSAIKRGMWTPLAHRLFNLPVYFSDYRDPDELTESLARQRARLIVGVAQFAFEASDGAAFPKWPDPLPALVYVAHKDGALSVFGPCPEVGLCDARYVSGFSRKPGRVYFEGPPTVSGDNFHAIVAPY